MDSVPPPPLTSPPKVHVVVWIGSRVLSRNSESFSKQDLLAWARAHYGDERPGLSTHISSYCVASSEANPGAYRYLTRVGRGRYRPYRDGDEVHPSKTQAPTCPEAYDVPPEFVTLLMLDAAEGTPAAPSAEGTDGDSGAPPVPRAREPGPELSEDELKARLKDWLEAQEWDVKVAWGKTRGIDVDARRGRERWIIEAKGSGSYAPMRVNFFLGALGETLQRMDDPDAKYSLALPDLPQYRRLWERLPRLARSRTGISILWVRGDDVLEGS